MSIMYGRWLGVTLTLMAAICLHTSQAQNIRVNITSTLKGNVGDSLVIECSLYMIADDGTVVFDEDQGTIILRRNGSPYNINRLTSNVGTTQKTYTLRDLEKDDDGGSIVCAAAEFTSSATLIEVCYAPEITIAGSGLITVTEGETATLDFVIDASPQSETTISSNSTSSVPSSLSINENNTVVVSQSVTRNDSGQYLFVSRNSVGESSVVFTLDVQYPPTFTSTVSKGFICDSSTTPITCVSLTGTNGTIFCDFESNPNGTLDPIMINAGGHVAVVGQNIHIIPATPGSTGNYICVATNIIQGQSFSSRREITLYVGALPAAVMNINDLINNTAVTIQWTYTQENDVPFTGFIVNLNSTTPTMKTVGPGMRQVVLSLSEYMLDPGPYFVTITAENLLGEGETKGLTFNIPRSSGNRVESCLVLLLLLMFCTVVL